MNKNPTKGFYFFMSKDKSFSSLVFQKNEKDVFELQTFLLFLSPNLWRHNAQLPTDNDTCETRDFCQSVEVLKTLNTRGRFKTLGDGSIVRLHIPYNRKGNPC